MRFRPKRTLTYLLVGVSVVVILANYISYSDKPLIVERHPVPNGILFDPRDSKPLLFEQRFKKYESIDKTSIAPAPIIRQVPAMRNDVMKGESVHSTQAVLNKKLVGPTLMSSIPLNGTENEEYREQFVIRIKRKDDDDDSSWSVLVPKIDRRNHQVMDDRILKQMNFVPKKYRKLSGNGASQKKKTTTTKTRLKTIYVPSGLSADTPLGMTKFLNENCLVSACNLTTDSVHEKSADLRLLQADAYFSPTDTKPPGQIWVMWILESPANTIEFIGSENLINWTATYRWDSTIVTPYAKFVPFSSFMSGVKGQGAVQPSPRNYAVNKTKMVAWFVSNCNAKNKRWEFALELSKYIPVDIYGACGTKECPRSTQSDCNERLNADYKFYLSFENSNCDHYITEKLFELGLSNDVVPIVMGARKSDYLNAAPPYSYIHVDDFQSAEELADYLMKLNATDHLYNEYFRWKGSGEFINTKFWCRLCALLHDEYRPVMWYTNFQKWWLHDLSCVASRWGDP